MISQFRDVWWKFSLCRATPGQDARWMSMSATPTPVKTWEPASMAGASSPASACQVRKLLFVLFNSEKSPSPNHGCCGDWEIVMGHVLRYNLDLYCKVWRESSCQQAWQWEMLTPQTELFDHFWTNGMLCLSSTDQYVVCKHYPSIHFKVG